MKYKAFLSYSRAADGKLAPALQSALQRFARPWYKRLQLHTLRVYRDETNLALSPHLWSSIEQAMNESEYFILLASPQAAQSKWVRKEITHWLKNRLHTMLLIVVTDGTIKWDSTQGDYDWTKTAALPPLLSKVFSDEPFYLDFRGIRAQTDLSLRNPTFLDGVARISAPLQGRSLDELIGENVRQHRNSTIIAWTIGTVFFILSVIASWQFLAARQQRDLAKEQLATFYWSQAVSARRDGEQLRSAHFYARTGKETESILDSALLAAQLGLREKKVPELRSQIQAALLNVHKDGQGVLLNRIFQHSGPIVGALFHQHEKNILTWSHDKTARLWQTQDGTSIGYPMQHEGEVTGALFSPDGQQILTWSDSTEARLWRAQDGTLIGQPMSHDEIIRGALFSPDGQRILTWGADRTARLWRANDAISIGHPMRHKGTVVSALFSPDGQQILTWSHDM